MRRTLLGALGALTFLAAAVPSVASAKTFDIDGDRFGRSPLVFVNHSCSDRDIAPSSAPTFVISRGPDKPPIGLYSSGWRDNTVGYGAGVVTHIDKPGSLKKFRVSLHSLDAESSGRAVVTFHPDGDDGFWFGNADLGAETVNGWHDVGAVARPFAWLHYDAFGNVDLGGGSHTIDEFVTMHGGDGDGAELGFIFGCNGNAFFLDRLQLSAGGQDLSFDMGGYNTKTVLKVGEKKPKKVTITVGQEFPISGYLYEDFGNTRIAGQLRFESRRIGAESYQLIARDTAGTGTRALLQIHPKRNTQYALQYAGNEAREPSRSNTLKVLVRVKVGAHILDSTITRGQTMKVVGKIVPEKRTTYLLQRFGGGSWHTVKKGVSSRKGGFSVGTVPASTGVSYWRVRALDGGGNVGNVSKNMKLTVSAPSGGGGGGGTEEDPPPAPQDPPPPEG